MWCGSVDTEINVPFAENPQLSEILSDKPGAGQNEGLHALPTASTYAVLTSWFSHLHFPHVLFKDSVVCGGSDFPCDLMACV